MKKTVLIGMLAVLGVLVMFNSEAADFRFIGRAVVDFRNETDQAITVVLNNNSEVHPIAAHEQTTFTGVNMGESPVFHVQDSVGTDLFSRRVGMVGAKASFVWDGNKF
jgi:hypothetical protein